MRKLTHPELVERQKERRRSPKLPLAVLLNNIRSLYNVGSIFRTADGIGIEKLWICGISGFPPDTQITKTALGAEKEVPWEYRKDACSVLRELKARGYEIVLLEQVVGSLSFEEYEPRPPVCLVLGNENEGVSGELLSLCDRTVEIDMAGLKNSLNVAVALGVVGFRLRERLKTIGKSILMKEQRA
ncbi:MAG: RNA methyltransferase [Candidatus Omnitrophica bacterium]|nr:RNA methyltransferase [Candidatus Omnitrophota bacterium]